MKTWAIGLSLILSALGGCDRVDNSFTVEDPQGSVVSAELQLCRTRTELTRDSHEFRAKKPIDCEGEGDVLVHLSSGRTTSCPIEYVTPGAEQRFEFVVEDAKCVPKEP
jgi:hypothetical protein